MTTPLSNLPPFKPTQVPGCALWLDAADASTLTLSGANVTAWKDKSGNGYNAIQPTSAAQPTYVSQSVYFGSNAQFMYFQGAALTMTQNVGFSSCFLVFVLNGTQILGQGTYILKTTIGTGTGEPRFGMYLDNAGSVADQTVTLVGFYGQMTDTGVAREFRTPSASNNVLTLANVEINYANNKGFIYTNGSNTASYYNMYASGGNTTNTASTSTYLNATPGNNGVSVYEMIFFNQAFTTAQRQLIEGYLAWKWGIQSSLPPSHPYYTINTGPTNALITIPPIPNYYLTIPFSEKNVSFYTLFKPTSIPGCALWLDASDASTLTLSGSSVTQWNDKSGNGRNATTTGNPTLITTSLNNNNGIQFSGATQVATTSSFVLSANSTISAFVVANANLLVNNNNVNFLVSGTNYLNLYMGISGVSRVYIYDVAGNGQATTTFANVSNIPNIYELVYSPNTATSYVNGTTYATLSGTPGTTLTTSQSLSISSAGGDSIIEYEIIFFSTALTTTQRQLIEGYLAWKWGLQASLPNGHPYASNERGILYPNITLTRPNQFVVQRNLVKWKPTQIPGCALWLDAADASTVTLSGSSVTQWNDKSGNGNNAIQGTTAFQPTYTNKSIFIANNSNYLSFTNLSILSNVSYASVFMVYNLSYISSNNARMHTFVADGTNDGVERLSVYIYSTTGSTPNSYTGVVARAADSGSISYADGTVNTAVGVNTIINGEVNYVGNQINDYINGSIYKTGSLGTTTNTATTNSKNIRIGGFNTGDTANPVYIFETLLYTTALTTTQRQKIEGYLAWKWGLKTSLPTNHPYRYIPVS